MSKETVKIGQLLNGDEKRDAIHVAVAPVMAACKINPGDEIGFVDYEQNLVGYAGEKIGIADPFLKKPVYKGQMFYLCLFPNTVTSLRHEWEHPGFPAREVLPKKKHTQEEIDEAKSVIETIGMRCNTTYEDMLAVAEKFLNTGDYTYENSESYKDVEGKEWKKFWQAYRIVKESDLSLTTAPFASSEYDVPFACSC